ncbi:MAG: head GIN domain-containing protein [Ekhidna sp.]
MKSILSILTVAITLSSAAQTRTVDVGSFDELSLAIPANLYLTQGSSEKVEIKCDDDIFEEIEFDKKGDRLVIKREGNWNWGNGWRKSEVDIYVTMVTIEELAVSGSGSMESKGTLKTEELDLAVSGSGDINLDIDGGEVEVRISGSGNVELSGKGEEAAVRISGSGRVKAEDLEVAYFKASISGSGSCYITATEEMKANISGSGSVYYAGNPKRIDSNSSGSGKVRKM